jgi:hypothetical protein
VHPDERYVVRVPTAAETLRGKAYLVVQRNQVRDYLDVMALTDRYGLTASAAVLAPIDDYYVDRSEVADSVPVIFAQSRIVPRARSPAIPASRGQRSLRRRNREVRPRVNNLSATSGRAGVW